MSTNEELVEELAQSTGCDKNLAAMILKFTGWDKEGAQRIIDAVPKDIFAVKVKFITQITGYFGAFFLCYDQKKHMVSRAIIVISEDRDVGKISLAINWRDFEEKLYDFSRNKKVDGLKIDQFKKQLLSEEFKSSLSGVLKSGKTDEEKLNNLLVDELYNVFTDTNIAVKHHVQMVDAFDMNRGKESMQIGDPIEEKAETARDAGGEDTPHRLDQSLVVLKIDPVLSPVSGTAIKDLEFGDEIQVRITDERDIAGYLADLLGAKVDDLRVPVMTKIVEVRELEGGNLGVITQFGPGIVGMFRVLEDTKIVTKGEAAEEPEQVQKSGGQFNPMILVAGAFVLVIIFILLIVMTR